MYLPMYPDNPLQLLQEFYCLCVKPLFLPENINKINLQKAKAVQSRHTVSNKQHMLLSNLFTHLKAIVFDRPYGNEKGETAV